MASSTKYYEWRTVVVGLPIIRRLLNGEDISLEDFHISLIPDDVLFANKPKVLAMPVSAVVQYTLSTERVIRVCPKCLLKVTETGAPDPYWYSGKQIADFLAAPAIDRCDHKIYPSSTENRLGRS